MPCDYSKYPPNWKTEIRPSILERAKNRCEKCGVKNYELILRGEWCGREVYQDMDGWIYSAENSDKIGGDYLGEVDKTGKRNFTKVILTIAHLDHDTSNSDPENLKALCQKCHLSHDSKNNREKAKVSIEKAKGIIPMFQ